MADNNPDSQEAKLRRVRRRLNFGDTNDDNQPSKEELQRKLEEERRKEFEEKKAKWNFDFKEGRPLEGRWEWTVAEKTSESNGTSAESESNTNNAERDVENPVTP